MAEPAEDGANGLFSALGGADVCTAASPGEAFQPRPCGSGLRDGRVPLAGGQDPGAALGGTEERGPAAVVPGLSALSASLCQALWVSQRNPELVSMG